MRIIKRLIAVLMAACVLLSGMSLAEAANMDAQASTEGFTTYAHDGRVTLIDGACTDAPIHSFDDAYAVVGDVLDQLGGDEDTHLAAWRELDDAFGNHYYVFQQMYNDTTVLGGAVKVIADAEGRMLGLTSSIEANPPEEAAAGSIAADEAERIVLDNALSTRQQALTVLEGRTERMILPIALELNLEKDKAGSRYVWVVYTDNPDSSENRAQDLPYLAHYVTLTGEYLYSLPTIMPGDEAGASGFDASYVFEFMEPVNYTGYVDLSSGEEMEISVDVMRDRRTGRYYLGNLERRIVVADCWEFLYGGNRVEGGRQDELPTGGLDTVKPKPIDLNLTEAQQDAPAPEPRMSRPKLAEAEDADEVSEEETDKAA